MDKEIIVRKLSEEISKDLKAKDIFVYYDPFILSQSNKFVCILNKRSDIYNLNTEDSVHFSTWEEVEHFLNCIRKKIIRIE